MKYDKNLPKTEKKEEQKKEAPLTFCLNCIQGLHKGNGKKSVPAVVKKEDVSKSKVVHSLSIKHKKGSKKHKS